MATLVCKYCSKEFIDTKNPGRTKYCSRACFIEGLKNPKRRQPCKVCGTEFYLATPTSKYCSKECRQKDGWIKKDPSKKSIFICDWCKKKFENWTYRQSRFCSNQCRSEFAARQPKPNAQKPEIHITKPCDTCGNLYQTTTHQMRERGSRFCSMPCRNIMLSFERRGEGNPRWSGGTLKLADYGDNWNRQKRRTKQRDNHTCQVKECGYKSGGDQILDVHHIRSLKEFNGNWKLANQLYNLISLCRPCHCRVEAGKIPCPIPKGEMAFDLY